MYPPATGRDEALAAVLSSDWLSGLPRSYPTTGTECVTTKPEQAHDTKTGSEKQLESESRHWLPAVPVP